MSSQQTEPTTSRGSRPSRTVRLFAWLNDPTDPMWERPGPTPAQQRRDVLGAALFMLAGLELTVLTKSMGIVVDDEATWRAYVAVAAMIAPLAVRRRFPLFTLVLSSVLFLALSYLSTEAAVQAPFQVAYFAALYAAVAWARDRRLLWIVLGLVLLEMIAWLVVTFTIGNAIHLYMVEDAPAGPLPPILATVLYTGVINLAYFGGAILVGRTSWRTALQRTRLREQADRIGKQADELARRAVIDERLRIARELHDVVAHHVSVIGVQAGAARRVLRRNPDAAEEALRTIEGASRDAVGEMRNLLGVLRSETDITRPGADARSPEPGLADLDDLVAGHTHAGLDVALQVVEEHVGDLERVPAALGLSVYRVAQESLANVVRHSTATHASVTLRTGTQPTTAERTSAPARFVELEVLDDGRPRSGTSGTGYGLRGVSERVALHGGEAEVGPRHTGTGWRVRARFAVRALDRESA